MISPLSLVPGIQPLLPSVPAEQKLSENILFLEQPVHQEGEPVHQPGLQELMEQIRQLARWPDSVDPEQIAPLPSRLNQAFQKEPCFQLEQMQVRILQLRETLSQAQKLSHAGRLTTVLTQHLLHAQQAASLLYRESVTPVQDSLWPLYERILRLPTLEPDLFGAAVATIQEKLPHADSTNPFVEGMQTLLPKLLPPAHYLWGQNPPFTEALEQLKQIKQTSRLLLHRLEKTEGYLKNFYDPLQSLYETYHSFLEEFDNASDQKKAAMHKANSVKDNSEAPTTSIARQVSSTNPIQRGDFT